VLQTLALVQRRADDPREVVRLARMQERELRAWLLSGSETNGATDVPSGRPRRPRGGGRRRSTAFPVEVVRVRDCPAEGLQPLLLAARRGDGEPVRHSGAPSVSVYLEVEGQRVSIFVRATAAAASIPTP